MTFFLFKKLFFFLTIRFSQINYVFQLFIGSIFNNINLFILILCGSPFSYFLCRNILNIFHIFLFLTIDNRIGVFGHLSIYIFLIHIIHLIQWDSFHLEIIIRIQKRHTLGLLQMDRIVIKMHIKLLLLKGLLMEIHLQLLLLIR